MNGNKNVKGYISSALHKEIISLSPSQFHYIDWNSEKLDAPAVKETLLPKILFNPTSRTINNIITYSKK